MSDPMRELADALNLLYTAREESKRTLLCEPHREHQIRAAVDQAGAADIFTVRASAACPEGKLLVIDEGSLEAQTREWQQGLQFRGDDSCDSP